MGEKVFTRENVKRKMYDALPDGVTDNIGEVAILDISVLSANFQEPDFQLFRLTDGFGTSPKTRGSACFGTFCKDGERARVERYDFIGIADEETTKYARELEAVWDKKKSV